MKGVIKNIIQNIFLLILIFFGAGLFIVLILSYSVNKIRMNIMNYMEFREKRRIK